ncbi:hypothetical protein FD755_002002, partial [Muntiacus reevesi]
HVTEKTLESPLDSKISIVPLLSLLHLFLSRYTLESVLCNKRSHHNEKPDEEEPKDEDFSPDGGYIPRILFLDPSGKVRPEIINENGNPSYKYFYISAEQDMKRTFQTKEAREKCVCVCVVRYEEDISN